MLLYSNWLFVLIWPKWSRRTQTYHDYSLVLLLSWSSNTLYRLYCNITQIWFVLSICFPCWLGHAALHLHSTNSPQQSHPFSARGLCLSVSCLQSIVSFQGRFNAMQKFANQLFRSLAYQTGLSSSSVRPVSLFVRFFCHSSSGWQKHSTSDPSSFSSLSFCITTMKHAVNQKSLPSYCQVVDEIHLQFAVWLLR